ncbi:hypothetical protein HX833_03785 [Marine Group I thaumarchaeote]|uniref:Uncharacterized protein n=1 Tax=Marine Group I thaumarchaeote TaxID=2511932 RepID=A0A7K4NQ63_9ARCH|nr:hypothetical protein [Marine Group I thaumarchaeote]
MMIRRLRKIVSRKKDNALKDEVFTYYTAFYDPSAKEPHCNCKICPGPENNLELLTIDHKRKRTKKDNLSGTSLYKYLKENDYPDGYQVLCFNCNFGKGLYGRCPHLWKDNRNGS